MSKKDKKNKTKPAPTETKSEEKITETTTEEITSVTANDGKGADAEIVIDGVDATAPAKKPAKQIRKDPSINEMPVHQPKRKISFLHCNKCGNQTTDLSEKSCSTCKGDLEPAYSSNPSD